MPNITDNECIRLVCVDKDIQRTEEVFWNLRRRTLHMYPKVKILVYRNGSSRYTVVKVRLNGWLNLSILYNIVPQNQF